MELLIQQDSAQAGWLLMEQDRTLLEEAEHSETQPILRFYEWSVPTISLGFHQSLDVLDEERIASDGVPYVRRPTGGAAVLHSQELTYAVIIPCRDDSGIAATLQAGVSRAIADGLRAIGVAAEVSPRGELLTALKNRTSCFLRTSRWEVTVHGRKIVGSAQRRLSHALLQHGSILTGGDHLRIVDYLRLPNESARNALRDRLRRHSTSVHAELGMMIEVEELRRELTRSFADVFAEISPVAAVKRQECNA